MSGAVHRLQDAWNANFFVVDQLIEARSNAERANILLRLPDAVIAARAEHLQDACRENGFTRGAEYVAIRLAHQSCKRDGEGLLPQAVVDQLEIWRRGMLAIAGGTQ